MKATHSPIFTHKCHFFQVKFFLKRRFFVIENFAKTTTFWPNFSIFFTKCSISKSRLGERKLKWPFFEVDNDIFSKSYLLTYLVFVSPHHPFTKMFDNKFDFSRFSPTLRFSPIFVEFRFRLSRIPNFKNHKVSCHVILNKNSFLILKQWINSHCRKNYPNMFFLVKQLNWNSSLQTLFIITLTRCKIFSKNFLKKF